MLPTLIKIEISCPCGNRGEAEISEKDGICTLFCKHCRQSWNISFIPHVITAGANQYGNENGKERIKIRKELPPGIPMDNLSFSTPKAGNKNKL